MIALGHASTLVIVYCPSEAYAANAGRYRLYPTPVLFIINFDTGVEYNVPVIYIIDSGFSK